MNAKKLEIRGGRQEQWILTYRKITKLVLTLTRTAGPVGPLAGLVGPLFDIAFEIHFDEVGMFFFEI